MIKTLPQGAPYAIKLYSYIGTAYLRVWYLDIQKSFARDATTRVIRTVRGDNMILYSEDDIIIIIML